MSPLGITASLRGALGEAHGAIEDLASAVRKLGERHAADHDVLHMSRTLGLKLDEATHALAVQGDRLGASLDDVEPDPEGYRRALGRHPREDLADARLAPARAAPCSSPICAASSHGPRTPR